MADGPVYAPPNRFTGVGAAVPSVMNTPAPRPSSAAKYALPPTVTNPDGSELRFAGLTAATGAVPAVVPSLAHSPRPVVPSSATNSSFPLTPASTAGALAVATIGLGEVEAV